MGKTNKIRIGIIGAGDIASRAHIPNFKLNHNCLVVAICSAGKKNAKLLAEKFNIPEVNDDYISLIKRDDIDAVSICTPTFFHKKIIELAILNNKHIFVEKPIAKNAEEAKFIIDKVRDYPKKVMVMFNNRYRLENQILKKKIDAGEIGEVQLIDMEWFRAKREINKEWLFKMDKSGGGVFIDFGSHLIDLALTFLGKRNKFSANGFSKRINSYAESDVEDLLTAVIVIDEKVAINLRMGWTLNLKTASKVNINVYGDKAVISNSDFQSESSDPYKKAVDDFIQTILENIPVDHKIYYDTMKLVHAVYKSCAMHKTVKGAF